MIYLDSAATSFLKPPSVRQAMLGAMQHMTSPGRGGHRLAMAAAETVYRCRQEAAALFHMEDAARVVFTMNATHALNIAIRSIVKPGDAVVISGWEHNAVTRPLHTVGAKVRIARGRLFDPDAVLEDFRRALPGAKAAVCTHVSNVFGFVLPIAEIAALCRDAGVPLIVDAAQSAGVLDVDFGKLGAAFIAMPGHKGLLGPQGTGLLLCGVDGAPLLCGGTGSNSREQTMPDALPDRHEAGTHNVPGIAGLAAGLEYVTPRRQRIEAIEMDRLRQLIAGLRRIDDLELFYDPKALSQCGVLSLRSRSVDSETLAERLAGRGVAVRGGLHCAPLAHESADTLGTGTVRLSLSPFLSPREIDAAAAVMRDILH